ncbi:rhodanese-like domain-containing protein [Microbaculum marinum]|uniref:Rhodanese-like domain-containing protein n=1 Tax=Microbaculum marinum TaxID=1764581 RepID=A0AAW9RUM7_9HYPH
MPAGGYRADLPSSDVWPELEKDSEAVLVDVRSRAEWTFVGVPDLSPVAREPVLLEWQQYPGMQVNGQFVGELKRLLDERGAGEDTAIFFLCRSGGRSAAAAAAMAAAGYSNCVNVSDGFEGPADEARHRGTVAGWKAAGLPWVQS